MVPHSYGPAFNCVRDYALVESAARCSFARVAHWVLRDRVRNSRDYFGIPVAQLANVGRALVSGTPLLIFALAREPASSPAPLFCSSHSEIFFASALFSRDEIRRQRFVEENAS